MGAYKQGLNTQGLIYGRHIYRVYTWGLIHGGLYNNNNNNNNLLTYIAQISCGYDHLCIIYGGLIRGGLYMGTLKVS